MKIPPKLVIGAGVAGTVVMGALVFMPRGGDTPQATPIQKHVEALQMYEALEPRAYKKLARAGDKLDAAMASTEGDGHATLHQVRAGEAAGRAVVQYLARLEVALRTQSHNNPQVIEEFEEVAHRLQEICQDAVFNMHQSLVV